MTRKNIVLIGIAVALGVVYVVFFTDLFKANRIKILCQTRPLRDTRGRRMARLGSFPVSFALDGNYRLKRVKVVQAGEYATNKYANPLWHLVSDSNSVPTRALIYGLPIRGMRPAVARLRPQPLEPGTTYTIVLEANSAKGQTNFMAVGRPAASGR